MPGRSQNVNTNFTQAFAIAAYTDPIPSHDALLVSFNQGTYNEHDSAGKTAAVEVTFWSTDTKYDENFNAVDDGVGPIVLHFNASLGTTGGSVNETSTQILPYRAKALGGITGCSMYGLKV